MITDNQVRKLKKHLSQGKTLGNVGTQEKTSNARKGVGKKKKPDSM